MFSTNNPMYPDWCSRFSIALLSAASTVGLDVTAQLRPQT